MNIGITTFATDAGKSGISQYLFNVLAELIKQGKQHQFELIVHESEKHLYAKLNSNNVRIISFSDRLRAPLINILWHLFCLPYICHRRGYDVLFLPAANRRLPLWCPCPTVGTVHDLASMNIKGKYDGFRSLYIRKLLPSLIRRLTRVLTVSEYSKKDIVRFAHVECSDIVVTHLATDTERFNKGNRKSSRLYVESEFSLKQPYILYVSRLEHPGKNHIRLIGAFERVKARTGIPHRLVFAGALRERGDEIIKRIKDSCRSNEIDYFEFVDSEALPHLYRAADFFILPSLFEGFGLPLLEAMSCGTPVACSDQASIPEVAGNAAIIFDAYSIDDIAASLEKLATESQLKTSLSELGQKRVNCFSWQITAQQTLNTLEEVTGLNNLKLCT